MYIHLALKITKHVSADISVSPTSKVSRYF
ncbi:hypothetical protein LMG28727_07271 [Paraburkholderia kirstenboschensis]|nr:hypothetical protein LMG28727_07271 [Paraburkholderia kirstenboschensis]